MLLLLIVTTRTDNHALISIDHGHHFFQERYEIALLATLLQGLLVFVLFNIHNAAGTFHHGGNKESNNSILAKCCAVPCFNYTR